MDPRPEMAERPEHPQPEMAPRPAEDPRPEMGGPPTTDPQPEMGEAPTTDPQPQPNPRPEMDPPPAPGIESAEAQAAGPVNAGTRGLAAAAVPTTGPAPAILAAGSDPATPPRRSRMRWFVAALIVVVVIGGALAGALLLGTKPLPEALRYVPSGSAVVVELRPDLPGDQRQHLGNFLAHLPGFADQSTLTAKIDEALARIVTAAGGGAVDYTTQVKPLLAGPMTAALSVSDLADASAGRTPSGLLLVATTDGKATCQSISAGKGTNGEVHRGIQLSVIGPSSGLACAVDGRFLLLGSPAGISGGLDAKLDGKGIDANATFRSARERLSGDHLALAYVDGKALQATVDSLGATIGTIPSLTPSANATLDPARTSTLPAWVMLGVRVVDDALQLESVVPPIAGPVLPSGLPSDPPSDKSHFAAVLPADAYGFVEAHGAGANIERFVGLLAADSSQLAALESLKQALASVGGIDSLVGWIQDLGVAGIPTGGNPGAVVLLRGADANAASSRLDQIRNLLTLASIGTDITVRTADHNGVPITTVNLGDLGPTLEALGAPAGVIPAGSNLAFSMARRGDILMVGIGDGVLERVIDVDASSSLASSPTYRRAIELAGSPNDLEAFIGIEAVVAWIDAHPPTGIDMDAYRANIQPYVSHLAGLIESTLTTPTGTTGRIIVTVK